MSSLADLHRTVETTLASKRLGRPVFVRYLWFGPNDPKAVLAGLTVLADTVCSWLGQPLERVYAAGGFASGQVGITLECREGATAVVSWTSSTDRGNGVDLMVLGNRGAMYHDATRAELLDDRLSPPAKPVRAELQALIEQALRSGKPEGAKP